MHKKRKFEVREHIDFETGTIRKDIFVDNHLFEYEVDKESYQEAVRQGNVGEFARQLQEHFLTCLSEFVGRKVTEKDVLTAKDTGWV